jgi:hypothetical protein
VKLPKAEATGLAPKQSAGLPGPFPRQPSDGEAYFYQNLMCKALPGARRCIEELSAETKTGIFVSHIGEERPAALRIKAFLETALTPAPPVVVSSDYESIESGEEWYRAILEGLKRSLAVIALLSPSAVDRRWINFEAGFGLGRGSRVIPVVWRGLSKGIVGLPGCDIYDLRCRLHFLHR